MVKKITLLLSLAVFAFQFTQAQTYFSDDFQDGDLSDWSTYDVDGDTYQWYIGDMSGGNTPIPEFDSVLISRSWIQGGVGALNPDNYVVSQAIDLTSASASNLVLNYAYGTLQNTTYFAETYSVYITNSNTLSDIQAATPILTETLSQGLRQTKSLDLSAYAGQTVYLTFRHHDTYDMNTMIIDEIEIKNSNENDAKVESTSIYRYAVISTDNTLSLDVKNNGTNSITSLEVNWNDGTTDHISTISTNIAPGATETIQHPTAVNYSTVTEKNLTITINSVNGTNDPIMSDNSGSAIVNTVSQSGLKAVVIEEGTGTWCGWCPRGAVAMDYMISNYPDTFIGVAVHNSDPMQLDEYNNGAAIAGFPGANVDRTLLGESVSQDLFINYHDSRSNLIVPTDLSVNGSISGNDLTINVSTTFYSNFANANFKVGVIVSENGVSGTDSGYNQTNYYANNANGAMGGYEALPDPVPASQMVYDHVGRALLGGYNGQDGSVPTTLTDGQNTTYTFNYTVPSSSTLENLHLVAILIDGDTGAIVNGIEVDATEALSTSSFEADNFMTVYPNPAKDNINVAFLANGGDYKVTITDMLGRTVFAEDHTNLGGNQELQIATDNFTSGNYILSVSNNKKSYSKQIIIQ